MKRIAAWTVGLVLALLLEGCGLNILAGGSVGTDNPAVNAGAQADVDVVVDDKVYAEDSLELELRAANQNPVLDATPLLIYSMGGGDSLALNPYLKDSVDYVLAVYEDGRLIDLLLIPARADTSLVVGAAPSSVEGNYAGGPDSLQAGGNDDFEVVPAYVYLPGTRLSWTYAAGAAPWLADLPQGTYRLYFAGADGFVMYYKDIVVP